MTGTLYIVPTPIGNMSDITARAVEVLKDADFVACEDTRVGGKLMMLLGLKKELVQHHEHNKKQSAAYITERIKNGERCALISDAGTPAVSDPGEMLVAKCHAEGVTVVPLTGACAAVCALSASGLPSRRFVFEGFLPEKGKERKERLAALVTEQRSTVIYCTPHDIKRDLTDLIATLGNRRVFIARELTKLNEQLSLTNLLTAARLIEDGTIPCKGEFALVLDGAPKDALALDAFWADMDEATHVAHYISLGFSKMDAIKKTAKDRGVAKSEIYDLLNDK